MSVLIRADRNPGSMHGARGQPPPYDRSSRCLTRQSLPGRVVRLARPHDGQLLAAYALTGRSPSSKARAIRLSRGRLVVSPCGPQPHDRLRHYIAAEADARYTVFGNGEQVSDVFARLSGGLAPWFALERVAYEPDSPIYTPRITAVVDRHDGAIWLGAARRSGGTTRAPTSASRP